ncbi:MAG: DUF3826 domain-containing protein [Verrucomicrobiota bacterium JB022]|nr:DUF3826 domain-containing protein [Verrucomicrobiota bacterium JB022]
MQFSLQNFRSLQRLATLGCLLTMAACANVQAVESPAADPYAAVAQGRAEKIVAKIELDRATAEAVTEIVSQQYQALNKVHEARDQAIAAVREKAAGHPDMVEAAVKAIEAEANEELYALNVAYNASLAGYLNGEQVDAVKDGMTYGRMPRDVGVFDAMLPDLTPEQRAQIYSWIWEAREHAITAGSSNEKHWWFDKYRGRINNYLAQAGYDLKQAEAEWLERERAKKSR